MTVSPGIPQARIVSPGVILTYDPDQRTLRFQDRIAVTIGNDR